MTTPIVLEAPLYIKTGDKYVNVTATSDSNQYKLELSDTPRVFHIQRAHFSTTYPVYVTTSAYHFIYTYIDGVKYYVYLPTNLTDKSFYVLRDQTSFNQRTRCRVHVKNFDPVETFKTETTVDTNTQLQIFSLHREFNVIGKIVQWDNNLEHAHENVDDHFVLVLVKE